MTLSIAGDACASRVDRRPPKVATTRNETPRSVIRRRRHTPITSNSGWRCSKTPAPASSNTPRNCIDRSSRCRRSWIISSRRRTEWRFVPPTVTWVREPSTEPSRRRRDRGARSSAEDGYAAARRGGSSETLFAAAIALPSTTPRPSEITSQTPPTTRATFRVIRASV